MSEVRFVQILEDIEAAISREIRRITFFSRNQRKDGFEGSLRESYDPWTGELVRIPIEPRFYDDAADAMISTSPRFSVSLLKLYEDLESKRLLPAVGNEDLECLPGPGAYEPVIGSCFAKTTDGGSDSVVELTHRHIRQVQAGHWLRITTGNNQGTYIIDSINLIGNGPHEITLSNDLLQNLSDFMYNKDAGILTLIDFVDISAVKAGDEFVDAASNVFTITAVNPSTPSLAVAPGSAVVNGSGGTIRRVGDVLQNDDAGEDQGIMILDPSKPVAGKATKYAKRSWQIPYNFLYYIKIASRERDDHIRIADRVMQVFNPPRGSLHVVTCTNLSATTELKADVAVGTKTILVEDSSKFYPNERFRICDNFDIGEELTVERVNNASNSITVVTPPTKSYKVDDCTRLISNYVLCVLERDFTNHVVEDKEDRQFWVHRFTYRIEGWIESRIAPYTTEQTFEEVGDVNFVQAALEDFDENQTGEVVIP